MNREQRRKQERADRRDKAKAYMKSVTVQGVPASIGINPGDLFTMTGVKRLKSGEIIRNCKPGEETVFVCGDPVKG